MSPKVLTVSKSDENNFVKLPCKKIEVEEGLGVNGDTHKGKLVQHLYRKRKTPNDPNLRQVHLIEKELLDDMNNAGFNLKAGNLGENITTEGIDLFALATGTLLIIGDAILEVTGLRTPCHQIDKFQKGLLKALTIKNSSGKAVMKQAVMAIVVQSGSISDGDVIEVAHPTLPHKTLEPV